MRIGLEVSVESIKCKTTLATGIIVHIIETKETTLYFVREKSGEVKIFDDSSVYFLYDYE